MLRYILTPVLLLSFAMVSCEKKTSAEEPEESDYYSRGRDFMNTMFDVYYWWYDQTPSKVTWDKDFYSYFDGHIVPQDRWSWMETGEEWRDSQTGTVQNSFGVSYGQPIAQGDYNIYVRYVLLHSPMYKAGVRRGWRLDGIGGYRLSDLIKSQEGIETLYEEMAKSSNTYVFTDHDSQSHTLTIDADRISTRTYLDRRIFTPDDYPGLTGSVGYFNYYTFVTAMTLDITETFSEFKTAGVKDIILDLRYNGGGSTEALRALVGYIAPKSLDGKPFSVLTHNELISTLNTTDTYEINDGSLSLDRIFVITGTGTASASEVLINGLRDGLGKSNVITVGDTTYGKPNGMYAFAYPQGPESDYYSKADYVFLPICFYTCNASGEQIPDTGFPPVRYQPDDIYHDWGASEELIASCLRYIAAGSFTQTKSSARRAMSPQTHGYKLPSEEDAPGYGRLTRITPR